MSLYNNIFTPARLQGIFDEVAAEFSKHLPAPEIHCLGQNYAASFGYEVDDARDFRPILAKRIDERKRRADDLGFVQVHFRVTTRIFEKQLECANLALK